MRRAFGIFCLLGMIGAVAKIERVSLPLGSSDSVRIAAPSITTAAHKSTPSSYKRNPLLFLSVASRDSLVLLPGVGPVLADRLIDARSGKSLFKNWDDVIDIRGFGPASVAKLQRAARD